MFSRVFMVLYWAFIMVFAVFPSSSNFFVDISAFNIEGALICGIDMRFFVD